MSHSKGGSGGSSSGGSGSPGSSETSESATSPRAGGSEISPRNKLLDKLKALDDPKDSAARKYAAQAQTRAEYDALKKLTPGKEPKLPETTVSEIRRKATAAIGATRTEAARASVSSNLATGLHEGDAGAGAGAFQTSEMRAALGEIGSSLRSEGVTLQQEPTAGAGSSPRASSTPSAPSPSPLPLPSPSPSHSPSIG